MHFMVHVIYGLRQKGHTLWLQSTGRRAIENFERACENENVLSKKYFFFKEMWTDDNCLEKDYRSRQDSNLRGETPMDF